MQRKPYVDEEYIRRDAEVVDPSDADDAVGYGRDDFEITSEQWQAVMDGGILELDAQGEYGVLVRVAQRLSSREENVPLTIEDRGILLPPGSQSPDSKLHVCKLHIGKDGNIGIGS